MTRRPATAAWLGVSCLCSVLGCTTVEDRVRDHERQLRSLASTATLVSNAWLSRRVSKAYAATALDETLALVERERAALGTDPKVLRDRTGGRLSDEAEQLARQLAAMAAEVRRDNGMALRQQLAAIPLTPTDQR